MEYGGGDANNYGFRQQNDPTFQNPLMNEFVEELMVEKSQVDESLTKVHKILQDELDSHLGTRGEPKYLEVDIPKKIKLVKKILIPSARYPEFNFIGKLMGPKGATLKALQERLGVKIHVLGKGSSKDPAKEKELFDSGEPKHQHFNEELHVRIESLGVPTEAFRKLSDALDEVRQHLSTDLNDEISRSQIEQLGFNPNQAMLMSKANGAGMRFGGPRGGGFPMARGPFPRPPFRMPPAPPAPYFEDYSNQEYYYNDPSGGYGSFAGGAAATGPAGYASMGYGGPAGGQYNGGAPPGGKINAPGSGQQIRGHRMHPYTGGPRHVGPRF